MTQFRWQIPTSDEELVEVFLVEVGEILQSIDNHMKAWTQDPGDKKSLTEIRRSFHTLKGSGRMVKALDLSEVAWKVERLLNQALAGTVPVSESLVKLVAAVRVQIPRLVDAFKQRRSIAGNREIVGLMRTADNLSRDDRPPTPLPQSTATTVNEPRSSPHELDSRIERCIQRADEALHRSEMALQQVRHVSTLIEERRKAAGQTEHASELARIRELVSRLSKDVADLRLESERSQREIVLRQSELSQLSEQRVRAKLAANMERLRSGIERDIEENRRTDTARFRSAALRLIVSALAGGLAATALILSLPHLR